MNRSIIEQTLRRAPAVRTPPALRQQLREAIELPRNIAPARETVRSRWSWIPALGFALWFLGCLVVLGFQSNWFQPANPPQSTELTHTGISAATQESSAADLAQLEKDLADVERLRSEVQRLRAELAELAKLREQNNALRAELAKRNANNPAAAPQQDFFATAYERAVRAQCINNLKQLCLAALISRPDTKSQAWPDRSMLDSVLRRQNNGVSLTCPADSRAAVEVLSPNLPFSSGPNIVYLRCNTHHCVGMSDGSAQMLSDSIAQVVQRDGQWVLEHSK